MTTLDTTPQARGLGLSTGPIVAEALAVAAALADPDRLAAGPRTSDELAAEAGVHPPGAIPGAALPRRRRARWWGLATGAASSSPATSRVGAVGRRRLRAVLGAARLGDEPCVQILRNCRPATAPGGRLLVVETILPPGDESHFGKVFDVAMLVLTGGRERTEAEYAGLFEAAGYRPTRVLPTPSPTNDVEGVAV